MMQDVRDRLVKMASERLRELVPDTLGEPRATPGEWEMVSLKGSFGALDVARSVFDIRGTASRGWGRAPVEPGPQGAWARRRPGRPDPRRLLEARGAALQLRTAGRSARRSARAPLLRVRRAGGRCRLALAGACAGGRGADVATRALGARGTAPGPVQRRLPRRTAAATRSLAWWAAAAHHLGTPRTPASRRSQWRRTTRSCVDGGRRG